MKLLRSKDKLPYSPNLRIAMLHTKLGKTLIIWFVYHETVVETMNLLTSVHNNTSIAQDETEVPAMSQ